MENVEKLVYFPKLPEFTYPKFPDQREILRFCLHAGFNNPAVQKVGDFLIEKGRLAEYREMLLPFFEASEAVRDRISDIAKRFGILSEDEPKLETPSRLRNPISGIEFEEEFKSPYFEETEGLPKQLDVFLCSPSRYRTDQEPAKVKRFKAAFMPQGANSIIEAATPSKIDNVPVKVAEYDDKAGNGISIHEIVKYALKHPDNKIAVCLTSVQTNQFTRAYDLALQLKSIALKFNLNLEVLIGGPHIMTHEASVIKLVELGVIPVQGEIEEGRFSDILADVLHGKHKPQYKFELVENISDIPLPKPTKIEGYASAMSTFQISRGCPHKCRFCSAVKIDGRKMRYKTTEETEVFYRAAIEQGVKTIFITDNNFLRNKNCRKILEMMARVKEEKGAEINIMFQSDLKVVKDGEIDIEFMDLCKEAGVFMIFFGQESFDPEVLKEMDKTQNLVHIANHLGISRDQVTKEDVFDYTKMVIQEWQKRGVAVNYTCILGLEGDKPGCGKEVAETAKKLGVDIVTPFLFTLLPGSVDYEQYVTSPEAEENRKKVGMKIVDINFNNADSQHPNVEFQNGLTSKQQTEEFLNVMSNFYRASNVKKEWNPSVLAYYLLHCLSAALGEHPMSLGIWRKEKTETELSESDRQVLENFIKAKIGQTRELETENPVLHDDKTQNKASKPCNLKKREIENIAAII